MNDFSINKATSAKSESRIWIFRDYKINWPDFIKLGAVHAFGIYHLLTFPYIEHYKTTLWGIFCVLCFMIGVTAGAHRFYAHRSFKATLPFQLLLIFLFYGAGLMTIRQWVRVHRLHHKHSDTEADPHNSNRGFFFSHAGWIFLPRASEVTEEIKKIDITDITEDPLLRITEKYMYRLWLLIQFLTCAIPVYYWNEDWYHSTAMQFIRYFHTFTAASSINSFAHAWGAKPYNKNIRPVENWFGNFLSGGEGYHNWHHTFPWDYRTPEFGGFHFDLTLLFLNGAGKIGWAYDFKTVSNEVIAMTILNKGDETLQHEAKKLALVTSRTSN